MQLRVIGALLMRELHTRYGRANLGFAWFIGEPIVFTFGVVALWSITRGRMEHNVNLVPFVLTGYAPMVMWRHCFAQAVASMQANSSLLYHRNVTMLDIFFARTTLEVAGAMLAFCLGVLVFGPLILRLADFPTGSYGLLIGGWLLSAWFAAATALIVAPVTQLSHIAEKLANVVGYAMIPLSGAFWMVDWLPASVQRYALVVPSADAYEMIRAGYFGLQVRSHYDLPYAVGVCAVMTLCGLLLMRRARHQLSVE